MKYRLLALFAFSPLTACVNVSPYAAPISNPLADLNTAGLPIVPNSNPTRPTTPVPVTYRQIQPITTATQFIQPLSTDVVVVRPVTANAPDPLPQPIAVNTPIITQPNSTTVAISNIPVPYPTLDPQNQIRQLTTENIRLQQQVESLNKRLNQLEHHHNTTSSLHPIPPQPIIRNSKKNNAPKSLPKPTEDIALIPNNLPAAISPVNMPDPTVEKLKIARRLYSKGDLKGVINTLRGADSGGDGSMAARHSMYLLLQTNHRLNYCQSVIQIGQRLVSRYANSPEAPEALYTVGECQRGIQQQDIAQDTWRKLIQTYPNSTAARRARNNMKNL